MSTKQQRLTKDEMMAYELVERMTLNPNGYIQKIPYWHGWAIREAYLEGCKDKAKELTNATQDKTAMRQAADRVAELRLENERLQIELDEYQQEATIHLFALSAANTNLKAFSIQFAPPDSVAEKAAVATLQAMTPEEVTQWIGVVYERRYEDNQRALEARREG